MTEPTMAEDAAPAATPSPAISPATEPVSAAAATPPLPTPVRLYVDHPAGMPYVLALVSEALFGAAVDLLDAREIASEYAARIGVHNRVWIEGQRERIVCIVPPTGGTGPIPAPPMLDRGALSENLDLLRQRFPRWGFALRSGKWEAKPTDDAPAQVLPGWMAEVGTEQDGATTVAAGFHATPEAAILFAALQMADGSEAMVQATQRLATVFAEARPVGTTHQVH